MTSPAAILIVVEDATLTMTVDRVLAAAGLQVVRAAEPPNRSAWTGAAAVLLDARAVATGAAPACGAEPRRDGAVAASVASVTCCPSPIPGRSRRWRARHGWP
ncbi:hypothetical protein H7H73_02055, partial [Mycobacterium rufum]|nr:hypothetical protein [Mycolicibacterium rufum]